MWWAIVVRAGLFQLKICHKALVLPSAVFMFNQAPAVREELLYFQMGIGTQ
jgi:hypothetical protein